MALPNYIIIGTQRGSTTSLHNYIAAHPGVSRVGKPRKEIHFFDYPHNWRKGLKWYRGLFIGRKGLAGEKSPTYLDHPLVPERIKNTCPGVKLIAILRNPVDRAYSDFYKIKAIGREFLATFEAALQAEPTRLAKDRKVNNLWTDYYFNSSHLTHGYVNRGQYARHLKLWFKHFDRSQMLILKSEELYTNPQREMAKVWRFLELEPIKLKKFRKYQSLTYDPMSKKTHKWLTNLFKPHNRELAEMLGDDKWLWK